MARFFAVRRLGIDRFEMTLPADVRDFLADLARQLDPALDEDLPIMRRLFPTAYPDDPERDAGYQVLARGELIDQRRASIETMRDSSDATELTEEQLEAWMRVVNDLRLVLGTQLDVSEEDDGVGDPDDPEAGVREVYEMLGFILESIVRALSEGLDD